MRTSELQKLAIGTTVSAGLGMLAAPLATLSAATGLFFGTVLLPVGFLCGRTVYAIGNLLFSDMTTEFVDLVSLVISTAIGAMSGFSVALLSTNLAGFYISSLHAVILTAGMFLVASTILSITAYAAPRFDAEHPLIPMSPGI